MFRNSIRAALLCAALCMLGAVTTSSAFAAAGEFTINQPPGASQAAITGEQRAQEIITVKNTAGSAVQIKCSVASFEGTWSKGSDTVFDLTLTGTYSGCTLGGLAATVKMNGCKTTLRGTAVQTATVDIVGCTPGKTMTVTKGNCTISFPEQAGLSHYIFISEGSASEMDLIAQETVSGMKSIQTGSECPAPGATQSEGTHSGSTTIKAFIDTGTRNVTKHEHTYSEVVCGQLTSITMD
jgi:hypothetical protein